MREFNYLKYELIGSGSGRNVYLLDNREYVIKEAKNICGVYQNKLEIQILKDLNFKDILPKCNGYDKNGNWVIVESALPFKYENSESYNIFENTFGIKFYQFNECIEYGLNNDFYLLETKYSNLKSSSKKFITTLINMIKKYDLADEEYSIIDQFGIKDSKIICLDFGISKEIQEKYYDNVQFNLY